MKRLTGIAILALVAAMIILVVAMIGVGDSDSDGGQQGRTAHDVETA